jgi:hypothetical protein
MLYILRVFTKTRISKFGYGYLCLKEIHLSFTYNYIVLLRDVFHIGLVIGPRPAVLA